MGKMQFIMHMMKYNQIICAHFYNDYNAYAHHEIMCIMRMIKLKNAHFAHL